MAALQTLHLAHLPPELAVHVALYTDIRNASFLRDQLLQGNPDFEYALVDASVVCYENFLLKQFYRNVLIAAVDTFNHPCLSSSLQSGE